jgi:hypothetical protein
VAAFPAGSEFLPNLRHNRFLSPYEAIQIKFIGHCPSLDAVWSRAAAVLPDDPVTLGIHDKIVGHLFACVCCGSMSGIFPITLSSFR